MHENQKIRFMIVDDEPVAHRIILRYSRAMTDLELVNQSYDAFQAMEFLRHNPVDLMFLDINMPDLNGFEFMRTLTRPPDVIVTTAHPEYALEGYELEVRDYLVKPFRLERFLAAVNKIQKRPEPQMPREPESDKGVRVLIVKGDKKHHRLNRDDILFVEACGNYCNVVTETERIMTHQTLSGLEKALDDPNFIRIHKSYVIATSKVTAVGPTTIEIGRNQIPIGQTYKHHISRLLLE